MNHTDAIIIGAGPCGLFQAFQLGLQGMRCHLIEAMPIAGGQCSELYPDKPIYDIPAIPELQAAQLCDQLKQQIKPFDPVFHFNQTVSHIDTDAQRLQVETSAGLRLHCSNVIIATGAGAFTAVKLRVEGIERFENTQLFYGQTPVDNIEQKSVVVTGDTPAAINTAIDCAASSKLITLLHRKRRLQIEPEQQHRIAALQQADKLQLVHGKIVAATGAKTLDKLRVQLQSRDEIEIPTDTLIARLGNSPKGNDFNSWNLATERNLITVDAADFSTSREGIYAVGDINTYPGKRKLILCGFHEATLVAFAIAKKMQPSESIHTLYTTTSTVLQQRLGLA